VSVASASISAASASPSGTKSPGAPEDVKASATICTPMRRFSTIVPETGGSASLSSTIAEPVSPIRAPSAASDSGP
jgi:hypothetical protein